MSIIQEAVKKTESPEREPSGLTEASGSWSWLPNLLMFFLLAIVLWNYLSEREYRRQMELRLDTTIADLESARADFRRIERQNRETEELLQAELEAANGRIEKMRFELEALRGERDLSAAALSSANKRVEALEEQNAKLHHVIQSLRQYRKAAPQAMGSLSWDRNAAASSTRSS